MQKFYLSTKPERILGVVFSAVAIVCMAILLYALRGDMLILCMIGACVLLVSACLVYYVLGVLRGYCVVGENRQLRIHGVKNYTLDLSEAVLLETIPVKNGQATTRALYFSDAGGKVVGIVPTFFNSREGIMADPMARELAAAIGLEFRANVPDWYYDKEKRIQHDKEVAQQHKEEAKARREAKVKLRREKLLKKYGQDGKK